MRSAAISSSTRRVARRQRRLHRRRAPLRRREGGRNPRLAHGRRRIARQVAVDDRVLRPPRAPALDEEAGQPARVRARAARAGVEMQKRCHDSSGGSVVVAQMAARAIDRKVEFII
jgi:hypothetical protein